MVVGEIQFFTNDGHQRRDAKPSKEAQKEGELRHVKGSHRGGPQVEKFNTICWSSHVHDASP